MTELSDHDLNIQTIAPKVWTRVDGTGIDVQHINAENVDLCVSTDGVVFLSGRGHWQARRTTDPTGAPGVSGEPAQAQTAVVLARCVLTLSNVANELTELAHALVTVAERITEENKR